MEEIPRDQFVKHYMDVRQQSFKGTTIQAAFQWCAVGHSATECKPNKITTGVEELVKVSQFLPLITQTPKWIQMMRTVIRHCDEFPSNENMTGIAENGSRHLAGA